MHERFDFAAAGVVPVADDGVCEAAGGGSELDGPFRVKVGLQQSEEDAGIEGIAAADAINDLANFPGFDLSIAEWCLSDLIGPGVEQQSAPVVVGGGDLFAECGGEEADIGPCVTECFGGDHGAFGGWCVVVFRERYVQQSAVVFAAEHESDEGHELSECFAGELLWRATGVPAPESGAEIGVERDIDSHAGSGSGGCDGAFGSGL